MTKVVFVVLLNPFSEGGGAGGGLRRKEDNQREGEKPGVMEVGLRGKARESKKQKKEGERSKVRLLSHIFLLPLKSFGLRLLCYNISAACSSCEI